MRMSPNLRELYLSFCPLQLVAYSKKLLICKHSDMKELKIKAALEDTEIEIADDSNWYDNLWMTMQFV